MPIVVQKYGGSSVADVEKIQRVAEKVVAARHAGEDVVVVVSAMGKTTDQLLGLARQVDENPPRRELDMLLSTGERISMALLSMAIQKHGCDAISFTGSQSGIITNDRHFDARIIEVRPHRVEDELARGRVVIVAGYQGMSYKREITTLGRGGSDTTALAMAAALKAARAEIYSDVDGVYSADPRCVHGARHLAEIRYEEMQEMAEAGAKVLHAQAVEFARKAGIAIHARSTFAPGRETIVHHGAAVSAGARAVVGQRAVARVHFAGDTGRFQALLGTAERAGVTPCEVEARDGDAEFLVATAHTPDWGRARDALEAQGAEVHEGLGIVSVVGDGFPASPTGLGDALEILSAHGVAHARIVTAPLRLSAVVPETQLDDAVRALHHRLVERIAPDAPAKRAG